MRELLDGEVKLEDVIGAALEIGTLSEKEYQSEESKDGKQESRDYYQLHVCFGEEKIIRVELSDHVVEHLKGNCKVLLLTSHVLDNFGEHPLV